MAKRKTYASFELIGARRIDRRVRQLAVEISAHYGDGEFTICAVMTGALIFTADLVRHITSPTRIVTIEASSYRSGIRSGRLRVSGLHPDKVRGHRVLLVDDIFDTGQTLCKLRQRLERLGAVEVRTCVLLRKLHDRGVKPGCPLDYVGFELPDEFVVGYGLDLDGRYRDLPHIARLAREKTRHFTTETQRTRRRKTNST